MRHSSFIQDGSFTRYVSFRHKFSAFHIETIALRSEHHSMIRRNPISIHRISVPYFTESRPFLLHRSLPHRNDYALQQSSPVVCHMDLLHRPLPHRNDYALSGLKHIGRQIVQPHEHVHILRDIPALRRDGLRIRPQGIPRTHGITGHFSGRRHGIGMVRRHHGQHAPCQQRTCHRHHNATAAIQPHALSAPAGHAGSTYNGIMPVRAATISLHAIITTIFVQRAAGPLHRDRTIGSPHRCGLHYCTRHRHHILSNTRSIEHLF